MLVRGASSHGSMKKTRVGQRATRRTLRAAIVYAPPSGSTAAVVSDPCASDASATYDDRRASNWASQAEPKNLANYIFFAVAASRGPDTRHTRHRDTTEDRRTPAAPSFPSYNNRKQECATRPRSSRPRPRRPSC